MEVSQEFRIKISDGGRLVIPSLYRKMLDIKSGDELIASIQDGELRFFKQKEALKKIREKVKRKVKNHTADFLTFRNKDSN
ncbi:MAG: hypothetical protein SFT90_00060 [Rickettsiales bacterium]|nr:hypothetical protein [Rickettsiales bacterium]